MVYFYPFLFILLNLIKFGQFDSIKLKGILRYLNLKFIIVFKSFYFF